MYPRPLIILFCLFFPLHSLLDCKFLKRRQHDYFIMAIFSFLILYFGQCLAFSWYSSNDFWLNEGIVDTSKNYSNYYYSEIRVIKRFSSVQFSRPVVSNSLRPHECQHARPPCPSPTSRVYSNSCPSCRWCHPAISSSVIPFSSCPQSLPASGSFPMSQLFAWVYLLSIHTTSWFSLRQTEHLTCSLKLSNFYKL